MTEKLYWARPDQTTFEASGVALSEHAGKPALVLKQTLFYPEGGGQLGDSGVLTVGGLTLQVTDTQIDDAGIIHHVLDRPLSPDETRAALVADAAVHGTIDAARRRDHTAQHTAQHALSRALADAARAETVSARLGATSCTIDLARPGIPDAQLHRAEDVVNDLIASNVEVRAFYPSRDEIAALPLRKQPKVLEGSVIRIIDIDGFDMTPCGGTHCSRSGQIGQVRIVALEKYKGMLRITFHAGLRALTDARAKHDALAAIAAELTCGLPEVPGAITKLRAEVKASRAALDAARADLAELVANGELARLPLPAVESGPIVLVLLRATDDVGALRLLAGKLAADPRVVALTGALDPASGELIFVVQRGPAGRLDCGAFIQAQGKALGGRGGGRPERAEGRFPKGTKLEDLAAAARAAIGS